MMGDLGHLIGITVSSKDAGLESKLEGGKGNAGVSTCHATGDASCNGN